MAPVTAAGADMEFDAQLEIDAGTAAAAPPANRWTVAIAAAAVMLTTGTLYSWAIFTQPLLVAFHWDVTTTTAAFAIANLSLAAVGTVIGGIWQDRVGPRRVALVGVTLWGAGNILAGLGTAALGAPWLNLTYGVVGGVGAGMAYITPVAMVTKWFPDQKGLAGGLVAAAFGLGAFVYNQFVPRLECFHAASAHAAGYIAAKSAAEAAGTTLDIVKLTVAQTFTAADITAVMRVLVISGLVFLAVGLVAASLFQNPPPHSSADAAVRSPAPEFGYPPSRVVLMPQLYLLWLQLFVSVISGLTIISNALFVLADLTKLRASDIAPLFGLVSAFNALGRPVWGAISDRIGCNHSFAAMFAVQAVALFLLSGVHSLTPALAGVAVILLCCGGGFGTMPSFSAGYFGTRFMGLNYALILSAWGVAGLVGPLLLAHMKDRTGSFAALLPYLAGLLLLAVMLPFITKKPTLPASAR